MERLYLEKVNMELSVEGFGSILMMDVLNRDCVQDIYLLFMIIILIIKIFSQY